MSVIDGGSFKCDQHKNRFETTDPKVWEEHLEKEHTESGTSVCAICGNQTEYQHKPVGLKPMCEKCKEAYSK